MRTRAPPLVKVCGLTTAEDALHAIDAGADALGFVFHPGSVRGIDLPRYLSIRSRLPAGIRTVAVFTLAELEEIEEVVEAGDFPELQIHGESLPRVPRLPGRLLRRAFDPARDDLAAAEAFLEGGPDRGLVLDPRAGGKTGGSGCSHRPEDLVPWLTRFPSAMLAGGLGPDNVAEVVRRFHPTWVDASSRLEGEPGRKDPERVRLYVVRAKGALG